MATFGTFTAGSVLTAAELNAGFPLTLVTRSLSSDQSIPSGTVTKIQFGSGTTVEDTLNWHSEVTNNTRITPTVAGIYLIVGSGYFKTNFTSRKIVGLHKNGADIAKEDSTTASTDWGGSVSSVAEANGSTDYFELYAYQNSGSAKDFAYARLSVVLLRAT